MTIPQLDLRLVTRLEPLPPFEQGVDVRQFRSEPPLMGWRFVRFARPQMRHSSGILSQVHSGESLEMEIRATYAMCGDFLDRVEPDLVVTMVEED